MKRIYIILAAFLVAVTTFLFVWSKQTGQKKPSSQSQSGGLASVGPTSSTGPSKTQAGSMEGPQTQKYSASGRLEAIPIILEEINDAAVMYDPGYLTAIQKYLLHQDPEVRKAAISGMIVLGHRYASPMLREASRLAPSPYEAVAMLEAADYLELPSASLLEDGKIKPVK